MIDKLRNSRGKMKRGCGRAEWEYES